MYCTKETNFFYVTTKKIEAANYIAFWLYIQVAGLLLILNIRAYNSKCNVFVTESLHYRVVFMGGSQAIGFCNPFLMILKILAINIK